MRNIKKLFAVAALAMPHNGSTKRRPLKVLFLPHYERYARMSDSKRFPVFESMWDDLAPSVLPRAQAEEFLKEVELIREAFAPEEDILKELSALFGVVEAYKNCEEVFGYEITPYGDYTYREYLASR